MGNASEQTLDFGLDIVDGVRRLDLERDGLPREGFDENLHYGLEGGRSASCSTKR